MMMKWRSLLSQTPHYSQSNPVSRQNTGQYWSADYIDVTYVFKSLAFYNLCTWQLLYIYVYVYVYIYTHNDTISLIISIDNINDIDKLTQRVNSGCYVSEGFDS